MSTLVSTPLADLLLARLSRDAAQPLQRQLYAAIRQAILDGVLVAGQRLPSTRALASELQLSRITVTLAFDQLQAEGYLQARHGSGTFVGHSLPSSRQVPPPATASVPPQTMLSQRAGQLLARPKTMLAPAGAFVPGVADTRHFPFAIWQRLQNRRGKQDAALLSGYDTSGGYAPLRRVLADYLQVSRAVRCHPDQILITTGTRQSLDLCARMLADAGDRALVEEPCNTSSRLVWQAAGLVVDGVPVDQEGICCDQMAVSGHPAPKLVLTTPAHQYPLGIPMSLPRRHQLLAYARAQGVWIVEDDYDSEFRYDSKPLPALQGLDDHERVIYLGTFSKVMYPGLRLSYLVVPSSLAPAFRVALTQLYRPGQLVLQAALADFIDAGYFATHIRRMRGIYAERQQVLRQALQQHFGPEFVLSGGHAGLHLTLQWQHPLDADGWAVRAAAQGLSLRLLSYYRQQAQDGNGLVLGYGAVATEDITDSVRLMRDVCDA